MEITKQYAVLEQSSGAFTIKFCKVKTYKILGLFKCKSIGLYSDYTEHQTIEAHYGGTMTGQFVKGYDTLYKAKEQIANLKAQDVKNSIYPLIRHQA